MGWKIYLSLLPGRKINLNKNKLCKRYIRSIRMSFPIVGKEEKKYILQLSVDVTNYYVDNSLHNMNDLYQTFGDPKEIVSNYYQILGTNKFIKQFRINRWIYRMVTVLLIVLLIFIQVT